MFTEQGFPFSHGERLRPLIRHSLQRVGPGVLIQPQPRLYAKVVCGAI